MADKRFAECYNTHFLSDWDEVARFPKPIIAAVNGYAVGLSLKHFFQNVQTRSYSSLEEVVK